MITGKLHGRGRTAIPPAVRQALGLAPGDEIAYRIEGDRAVLTRAAAGVAEDPFAAFLEWASEADRRAYGEL